MREQGSGKISCCSFCLKICNYRIGSLKRASINLRLRMRRDFLRVILGAPGEIHLSQTLRESVCHLVRQPFLYDEFLQTRTSDRGYGASFLSDAEILAKNRLARGLKFNVIDFGANMEGKCPANLDSDYLQHLRRRREAKRFQLTMANERKAIWYTNPRRN